MESRDCKELGKAVEAIEMALTHEQSSVWAKTWFYRGNIYFDVYISQDGACHGLTLDALDFSYDSYQKALGVELSRSLFVSGFPPPL